MKLLFCKIHLSRPKAIQTFHFGLNKMNPLLLSMIVIHDSFNDCLIQRRTQLISWKICYLIDNHGNILHAIIMQSLIVIFFCFEVNVKHENDHFYYLRKEPLLR